MTCVYPGCENSRRTRGLCHGHYQTMRAYVRAGKSDEADLMERGLLLPKGTGGGTVNGHEAFLRGSDVRGDADDRVEYRTRYDMTDCATATGMYDD